MEQEKIESPNPEAAQTFTDRLSIIVQGLTNRDLADYIDGRLKTLRLDEFAKDGFARSICRRRIESRDSLAYCSFENSKRGGSIRLTDTIRDAVRHSELR